jgi:polyhydroxyalkanoate synthesis regulator phasin/predicted RNA-binding Zn-ribbon protein involved in translation (DUF1610 family)
MAENDKREREDRLVDAYERMLGRTQEQIERAQNDTVPALRELLDRVKENMVELGELTREEATKVAAYVERDIQDAATYIAETGEDLRKWWRFDLELIEQRLLDAFSRVADQTSLQLSTWAERARRAGLYEAGEVAAPGTLVCTACGSALAMPRTARIPACAQCGGTSFRRAPEDAEAQP